MCLVNVAVREDDIVHTAVNALLCLLAEILKSSLKTSLTLLYLEEDRKLNGLEALVADVTENIQLSIGKYWLWQTNHLAVALVRCQDVCTYRTDILCE